MSDSESSVPYGYCHCGCGQKTSISDRTHTKYGHVKGEPMKFIRGHATARARAANKVNRDRKQAILSEQHREQWRAEHPDVPYGTCVCGCGESTTIADATHPSIGRFKGLPMKYRPGHFGRNTAQSPIDRSVRDESTGCLIHQGPLSKAGYAVIKWNGKSMYAHRFVYEQENGPIPEGMDLHHTCNNRACQEITHLQPITPKAHGALSSSHRTKLNANTKLTQEKAREIRRLVASGHDRTEIARQFGVAYTTVSGIVNGWNWKE